MTQWYYADAQRQRQGPVDTDTLRARLSQGIVDGSSLVWREGLAQWVALHEVEGELKLRRRSAGRGPGSQRADAGGCDTPCATVGCVSRRQPAGHSLGFRNLADRRPRR